MIKIRSTQDFWAGILLLGFGVVMFIGAADLAQGTALRMGPGYTPRILCGLLVLTGLALAVRSMFVDGPSTGSWNIRALVFVLGSVLVFAYGLERLGLVITTFVTVGIGSFAMKHGRPLEVLIVAACIAVAVTLLFVYGIKLVIPVWPQLG